MLMPEAKEKFFEEFEALPTTLQKRVWSFTRALALAQSKGVPGEKLVKFANFIPRDDLQRISDAIEAGCERVDNEW